MRALNVIPFHTGDQRQGRLLHIVESEQKTTRGPVLLVPGTATRGLVFCPPNQPTVVDALLAAGYDVWIHEWRGCLDIEESFSLDQVALYDHPAAIQTVCAATGVAEIKALTHCLGSATMCMAAVAGLIPQVRTLISNAVTLHPIVPWRTRVKTLLARRLVASITDTVDPRWGPENPAPHYALRALTNLVHSFARTCDNPVCQLVNFYDGMAQPRQHVLWRHQLLSPEVHTWVLKQFGRFSMRVFLQLQRSWRAGHMVRVEDSLANNLPEDYIADITGLAKMRVAFFAGSNNSCFLPMSQHQTYTTLREWGGSCSYYEVPNYSHLDMFIGRQACRDVFPLMLDELEH